MITLPDKIKNDLSSSAYQLQYLLEIGTDTPILIGTRKQNLLYQYIEDHPEGYSLSEELFEQPLTYGSWTGSLTEYDYENDNIVINNPSVWRELVPGDTYSHAISYGRTYECTFEISGDFNTPNYHFFWIGHHNYYRYYFNAEGTYTVIIPIDTTAFVNSRAGFMRLQGATIHSLSIKEIIPTEAYSVHRDKYIYYEDANMKVSNLKEKIDLKTKKIQYSDFTFTLSNLEGINGRLSDNLDTIYGADISLYAITQSCDSIMDKLPIARLKATRMDHDDTTVKISANDRNIEGFYVNLPKTLLEKDVNTYEAYNLKPVPILYGHLENAPATVYLEEDDYNPRLIVDDSYFTPNKEIEGIKKYNTLKQYGLNADPVAAAWKEEMISPNCVKVQLGGDSIVDVICRPYINSRDEIRHEISQYYTTHDFVGLRTKLQSGKNTLLGGVNALWCSHLSKATIESTASYEYHRFGSIWHTYGTDYVETMVSKSVWWDENTFEDFDNVGFRYRSGIQQWVFDDVSGASVYSLEDAEPIVDVHYIGNLKLVLSETDLSGSYANTSLVRIFGHYSPYKHDEDQDIYLHPSIDDDTGDNLYNMGDIESSGYGSPDEYLSGTGAAIGNSSYDYNQYYENNLPNEWAMQRNAFLGESELPTQYVSYLTGEMNTSGEGSYWQSNYDNLISGLDKGISAKTLTLYYMVEPNYALNETPETSIAINPYWEDLMVRKTWANEKIFENSFYVNARGRVDTDVELDNVYKIKAKIKVLTEIDMTNDVYSDKFAYQHWHHLELYKLLTDKGYHKKTINGEGYDLMMRFENSNGSHYIWDIDVNNMFFANEFGTEAENEGITTIYSVQNGLSEVSHTQGWVYDITAKNYNEGILASNTDGDGEVYGFPGFELIYGKINWEDNQIASIDTPDNYEDSLELFAFNFSNFTGDPASGDPSLVAGDSGITDFSNCAGLSRVFWLPEDIEGNFNKPIDNGAEIIKNLTTTEMGIGGILDEDKYLESIEALNNSKMAFSINEQKKSQEILENICSQSRLTFRYRPRDTSIIIDHIKNEYDKATFNKELHINDMLSYKYSKTKVEDLCIGGCSVKWGWDYEKEENVSITEEINLSEDMLEQYKLFYGIIEEDNHKLELEAPYISDEASAIEFRNFMFQYYKNQHTILKCSLTIQQGFELEVGDVLKINSYEKVYGALLQDSKTIIDQEAYPLFYITSLTKSLDKVDMECVQLHNLSIVENEE